MGLRKRCCSRAREDVKGRDLPLGSGALLTICLPPKNAGCVAATTENGCSVAAAFALWRSAVC